MKHSSFDATISALDAETSALDVETSAFGAATSAITRRSFDATISTLDAETSAIARSYRRYWRGVSGDIGDCGVGVTPQMCNRVTNHGDRSTFSKPASCYLHAMQPCWKINSFLSEDWGLSLLPYSKINSFLPEVSVCWRYNNNNSNRKSIFHHIVNIVGLAGNPLQLPAVATASNSSCNLQQLL